MLTYQSKSRLQKSPFTRCWCCWCGFNKWQLPVWVPNVEADYFAFNLVPWLPELDSDIVVTVLVPTEQSVCLFMPDHLWIVVSILGWVCREGGAFKTCFLRSRKKINIFRFLRNTIQSSKCVFTFWGIRMLSMRLFSSGICACISSGSLVPLETLGGEDDVENKLLENFFFSERKTKVVLAGLPICRCCLFESKNILNMNVYVLETKYISKMGFCGEAAILPVPIGVDRIQFVTIICYFTFHLI